MDRILFIISCLFLVNAMQAMEKPARKDLTIKEHRLTTGREFLGNIYLTIINETDETYRLTQILDTTISIPLEKIQAHNSVVLSAEEFQPGIYILQGESPQKYALIVTYEPAENRYLITFQGKSIILEAKGADWHATLILKGKNLKDSILKKSITTLPRI